MFGLAPALHASRAELARPLKDSGRGASGGIRGGRLRNALVIAEFALSLVLLSGAGLLMRSFLALMNIDLGFDPDRIVLTSLPLPDNRYHTAAQLSAFFRSLLDRVHRLPGVVAAAPASSFPPFGGLVGTIDIPGKPHSRMGDAMVNLTTPDFFRALDVRFLRGRPFTEAEVSAARRVAVINEKFVRTYFGGENPLGRQVRLSFLEAASDPVKNSSFEVIGVVADIRNQGIRDMPIPEVIVPFSVTGSYTRSLVVRTAREGAGIVDAVRRQVSAVDQEVAVTDNGTVRHFLRTFAYAEPRFSLSSQLWGVSPADPLTFAAVIALLAGVGFGACLVPARRAASVDPSIAPRLE